jgi:hypothetical protein
VYCRLDRESIASHLRNFVRLLQTGGDASAETREIQEFIEVAK